MSAAGGLPPRAGAGFKPEHAAAIRASAPVAQWFEIHAENYMGEGGMPHRLLSELRERFPLSLHGVGLSIGGEGPLDRAHLARLRKVADRYRPASFSEHLAWSSHEGAFLNDLLPLPYTEATLARVAAHVAEAQDAVGMRLLLENPSHYLEVTESALDEIDFLAEVAQRTGCGLLLDVNNVAIAAANRGTSAEDYIDRFPLDLVGEIHLAGHAEEREPEGTVLRIDTHDRPVAPDVWALYRRVIARGGPRPTLIERDADLPPWEVLAAEVAEADRILAPGPALAPA